MLKIRTYKLNITDASVQIYLIFHILSKEILNSSEIAGPK